MDTAQPWHPAAWPREGRPRSPSLCAPSQTPICRFSSTSWTLTHLPVGFNTSPQTHWLKQHTLILSALEVRSSKWASPGSNQCICRQGSFWRRDLLPGLFLLLLGSSSILEASSGLSHHVTSLSQGKEDPVIMLGPPG